MWRFWACPHAGTTYRPGHPLRAPGHPPYLGPLQRLQLRDGRLNLRGRLSFAMWATSSRFPPTTKKSFAIKISQGCGPRVQQVAPFRSSSRLILESVFPPCARSAPSGRQKGGHHPLRSSCRHPGDRPRRAHAPPALGFACHQHGQTRRPRTLVNWASRWQGCPAKGVKVCRDRHQTAHRPTDHLRTRPWKALQVRDRARPPTATDCGYISFDTTGNRPGFRAWYRLARRPAPAAARGPEVAGADACAHVPVCGSRWW